MEDAPSVKQHKARLASDPEYAKWYAEQMAENARSNARMAAKKVAEDEKLAKIGRGLIGLDDAVPASSPLKKYTSIASSHWQEVNAPHNKPHIEKIARVLESGHDMAKWFAKNPKMLIGPVLAGAVGYVAAKKYESKNKKGS